MIRYCSALLALSLSLCPGALAGTLTLSSTAVPTITLAPSQDSLSLKAGSIAIAGPGDFVFQSGDWVIGNSPIDDQDIPFSFDEAVTLNGVSRTITVFGDDSVSQGLDVLTIHAGSPILFGGYLLTLDRAAYSGTWVGEDVPITLSGQIAATPEPGSLILLGSGVLGGLALLCGDKLLRRGVARA